MSMSGASVTHVEPREIATHAASDRRHHDRPACPVAG
jgi:hypothetical protein